ncbi:MAG: hypothetical protein J7501_18010 [Bdellovibrio sp.]|nr:hypothetical protein [Bdellovibrio sp.]
MTPARQLLLILSLSTATSLSHAMNADEERLRGFAEHQKNNMQFEKAREQGERAYLEESEQWELAKKRDEEAYRKLKNAGGMSDDGPEAREDEAVKRKYKADYDKVRREYVEMKAHEEKLERRDKGLPTEMQELGLDDKRPRFDYVKRRDFGGKGGISSRGGSFNGSSGGFSRGSGTPSSGGTSFPPPPSFDDFDSGYVPAPNISPDDFGDVPPPPPPPQALPGGFDSGDYIPPPPAPLTPFDDNGGGDF